MCRATEKEQEESPSNRRMEPWMQRTRQGPSFWVVVKQLCTSRILEVARDQAGPAVSNRPPSGHPTLLYAAAVTEHALALLFPSQAAPDMLPCQKLRRGDRQPFYWPYATGNSLRYHWVIFPSSGFVYIPLHSQSQGTGLAGETRIWYRRSPALRPNEREPLRKIAKHKQDHSVNDLV